MEAIVVIILVAILVLISVSGNFIKKKVSNSLDNAFENITANRRSKNLQQQGTQSLADRHAGLNKTQPKNPNDVQN